MDHEFTIATSKGQVVIPARFRKALNIKPGTKISVQQVDGHLVLQPITHAYIDNLCGSVPNTAELIKSLRRDHELENGE